MPASTAVNWPEGGSLWPRPLRPQQAMVLSTLMAQEWRSPAATAVYSPEGALLWPAPLRPQQAMVLSTLMAQEWPLPDAMVVEAFGSIGSVSGSTGWPLAQPPGTT